MDTELSAGSYDGPSDTLRRFLQRFGRAVGFEMFEHDRAEVAARTLADYRERAKSEQAAREAYVIDRRRFGLLV